jgi:predicted HicB family RNase H-like nuclease
MQEQKTEIINARVTKSERQELRLIAKNHKKSISELIRETINNYKKTTKNGV